MTISSGKEFQQLNYELKLMRKFMEMIIVEARGHLVFLGVLDNWIGKQMVNEEFCSGTTTGTAAAAHSTCNCKEDRINNVRNSNGRLVASVVVGNGTPLSMNQLATGKGIEMTGIITSQPDRVRQEEECNAVHSTSAASIFQEENDIPSDETMLNESTRQGDDLEVPDQTGDLEIHPIATLPVEPAATETVWASPIHWHEDNANDDNDELNENNENGGDIDALESSEEDMTEVNANELAQSDNENSDDGNHEENNSSTGDGNDDTSNTIINVKHNGNTVGGENRASIMDSTEENREVFVSMESEHRPIKFSPSPEGTCATQKHSTNVIAHSAN